MRSVGNIILVLLVLWLFWLCLKTLWIETKNLNKDNEQSLDKEIILGVSMKILTPDGFEVIQSLPRPFRHHHLFRVYVNAYEKMQSHDTDFTLPIIKGLPGAELIQGFYTNKRKFVDRREARIVAAIAGQLQLTTNSSVYLFSEDVWDYGYRDVDLTNLKELEQHLTSVKKITE